MNQADIRGRNLASGWPLDARLAYLDARLTDLTPADPLQPMSRDTCRVEVRAARVQLDEKGVNQALDAALRDGPGPLTGAKVSFKPGNRVHASALVRWNGLPVPVSADYRIERVDANTVRLAPDAISAFGLPARAVLKALGIDLGRMLKPPAGVPARVAADGTITLALDQLPNLKAPLTALSTGNGTLTATVGGAPSPEIAARRRRSQPDWFELQTRGELDTGAGVLRDATVVCSGDTGCKDLPLVGWQEHGKARLERGSAAIDPAVLKQQIEQADPLFKIDQIQLVGTTYQVRGTYNAFVKLPTRLDLAFTRTPDGRLRVEPGGVRVCGLGLPGDGVGGDFSQFKFLKPEGDGFVVDLAGAAGLDMPRVGRVANEDGRLVLGN